MKLAFKEISKKKSRYVLTDGAWLPAELSTTVSDTAARVVVYKRDSSSVVLQGALKGFRSTACDRCGDSVTADFQISFLYIITTKEEEPSGLTEFECTDEEAQLLHVSASEPEVDIGAVLAEQTYLAIPLKTLCREGCRGICPGCGAALNSEKCLCISGADNSPFAVLKNLVKK